MKRIIIILSCLAFFCSCSKNKRKIFDKNYAGISFFHKNKNKNINLLFYPEKQKEVTVKIPVRILGQPQNRDRYYSVSLVKDKTTAKEGDHYKKLKNKYLFKKGLYEDSLSIVLKTDKIWLTDKTYKLTIKLKKSEDFDLGVEEDTRTSSITYFDEGNYYRHQMTILITTNFKEPPGFWKYYSYYLDTDEVGPYHYKKVQKFIEIAGIKKENWRVEYNDVLESYIRETRDWFRKNKVLDEEGNRLYFEQR